MIEDARHRRGLNGSLARLPFVRVSQEITFPTREQVFVFTLLSVTCQTTLATLDSFALTHNVVPANTSVPS